jgi:hypothetical protein
LVAEGQSAVWYSDEGEMLGGGVILGCRLGIERKLRPYYNVAHVRNRH